MYNKTVIMASAVAAILTVSVLTTVMGTQAFAREHHDNNNGVTQSANGGSANGGDGGNANGGCNQHCGGNGGIGGAGGAGGVGGNGGTNNNNVNQEHH